MTMNEPIDTAPVILTERLLLRPHRLDDLDNCTAIWSDADVVRFINGVPWTRSQCWGRLLRYSGSWKLLGFGFWAIEERETGRYVGEAGFLEGLREMTPSIEGTMETGWVMAPSAHGKGYATEALKAMIGWGEARYPDQRVTCIISPENAPSIRVAEKLGFREFARADYNGSTVAVFERDGRS